MEAEEYQWRIKLVQDRNHSLNLSLEQAELIYKYEEDKDVYSEKNFFSTWEEWDYEFSSFRKILSGEQFILYEKFLKDTIENYSKSLVEQDRDSLKEVEFYKETIKYYEEEFLPGLFEDPMLFTFSWMPADKPKIEFLKAEYKKYLNESKKEILISHVRNYRTYKPNELEVSLLGHKLSCLWPQYSAFKPQMDAPAKATAEYLKQKLTYFQEKYDDLIKSKLERLQIFNEQNFKKYHKEKQGGWHTTVSWQLTIEKEKEYRIMTLLLLDREKYDW